jgi:DNA-binding response OmpR family regulator
LIVEDHLVSNLVRAVLRKRGYQVRLAEPTEAAALLHSPDAGISVLITNTPGLFLEFATRVPLLYLSSQPDLFLEAAFRECRVVLKPFAPEVLADAVEGLAASF